MTGPALPTRLVKIGDVPRAGQMLDLRATAAERRAMADSLDLIDILELTAELKFAPFMRDGIKVEGKVVGRIVQACVVTLEPIESRIEAPVAMSWLPVDSPLMRPDLDSQGEWLVEPEGEDAPEPLEGDRIDAWAIVHEVLTLAIDPFPRVEGAEWKGEEPVDGGGDETRRPFAGLDRLLAEKDAKR